MFACTPAFAVCENPFVDVLCDVVVFYSPGGGARKRVDPYLDLDLAVGGITCLEDAIRKFVTPEELSGDNQWFCETCGVKVDAQKGMGLQSLPEVLTIQLKR